MDICRKSRGTEFSYMEKQHLKLYLKVANCQNKSGVTGYVEMIHHLQLYSLALRQTTFISVAGSTVHASTCKGHWDSRLNGCRSRSQAYTESTNNNSITHVTKPQRSSQACVKSGVMKVKRDAAEQTNTAADGLRRLFTCVTFIGVKLHRGGSLRAGASVSTRSEETQVAAYILTRVGH